jgi:hypothetical protein
MHSGGFGVLIQESHKKNLPVRGGVLREETP